jgi:hypothetical protein
MSNPRASQAAPKAQPAKAAKQTTSTPARSPALPGSPAQLRQLQRQYGNQAVQPTTAQERTSAPTLQRAGVNDQPSYSQPANVLGVTGDLKKAEDTPEAELRAQVTRLIDHAVIASTDFKALINGVVSYVNAAIPGGCVNGDPGFGHVTKGLQGSIEKAQGSMEGGTVADMKDVLRGTVKCRNNQAMRKAQEYLDARAARLMTLTEITVGGTQRKDGFEVDKRKGPGGLVGYGDIKYLTPVIHWLFNKPVKGAPSVRADFWMYAEIQLMTDAMNAKKMEAGGHTFYDVTREAKKGGPAENPTWSIAPTANTGHATKDLLDNHLADLRRGVNAAPLATLLVKLRQLQQGGAIELTNREYEGLALAGELIYRKERVEGNFERQGIGAGGWTV